MSKPVVSPPKVAQPKVSPPKKRKFRRTKIICVLVLGLVAGLAIYLNSDSFRETVRRRVVAELEQMTGGKVEIQSFDWKFFQLQFEARGLTIHGREGTGELPYAHADRVSLGLKIVSFFSRKVALRQVVIDHVVIHLMVYPDGTTNQPVPKNSGLAEVVSGPRLFDLAVNQVEITNGTLVLNQEKIPFELSGKRFSVGMSYSKAEKAYDGNLSIAAFSARYGNATPLHGDLDLHFLMRSAETEIKSLKLSVQHSTLSASGSVRNYNNPEIKLQYDASLNLAEVAKEAKITEVRAGHADLKGVATYQNWSYASEGNLTIHGLEWRDASFHAAGVEVASSFSVTPEKLLLPRLTARAFGGSVQGDVQVTNWNVPGPGHKRPAQQGVANLRLSGLQIIHVAAAVSTARLPLDKIELAGNVSGDIKASWSGSLENARAEMKLDVNPPAHFSAQQVPVTAQLQATYHGDLRTLDVAMLTLATRAIRVNATGVLGSETAQAKVTMNAADLHEIQPGLAALSPGTRVPFLMGGRTSFSGVVYGKLNALSARGHLEMDNFDTEFLLSASLAAAAAGSHQGVQQKLSRKIHWDSLAGDLTYTPSEISLQRGTLRRGPAQVGLSLTVGLREGRFDKNSSRLTVNLHVQGASVEDMQTLLGFAWPVTGVMNADVQASGTLSNLRGEGNLQITKLTAYGEPFRTFHSNVHFAGTEVRLDNISLAHNGSQLTGFFAYDLNNRNFHFDLTGVHIDFENFRSLAPARFTMEGQAGFHVTGSGTQDAPVINGQLDLRNMVFNHEQVGSMTVSAETHGADLVLRGRSSFENATLNLDGHIGLRGGLPGEVTLQFSHLDFDPLIRAYFQGHITGHSSIAGSIDIRGPMRRPHSLVITGNISQLSADIENVKLKNDGAIHLTMENETVRVEEFHLVGPETDLSLKGSMQLGGDHAVDLRSKGRFNLRLLQGYDPNIVANGPATFTVDVRGNWARPQMNGHVELADASMSLVDLPNGLSHINGTLIFAQDRMQIEKLTAHTGGGELNVGGFLTLRNGLYFDLTANGTDIRLRYPPGVSASADARLRYTGSAKNSLLAGDVIVTRFGMNPRFDFATYLAQSQKAPMISTLNPFLDNMRLDLHITSTPELRVETSLAKLSGDLDLHVRGTAARPAVVGRVNIAEGDVFFNGTKYRLERGDITFSNPLTIEPVVNIDMSARVQGYDVTIGLHGQVGNGRGLSMNYRSDPPLSNADIIALLAFGRTRSQGMYSSATQPGGNSGDTAAASNAILGQALDATFSDRVQRLFGASRVKIDPQFVGSVNNPSARVTIEQQINNNMTLTYTTSLTQSAETVVQLEYNIDKNVSIVAVRDQNGVVGFDVHIRRRKK